MVGKSLILVCALASLVAANVCQNGYPFRNKDIEILCDTNSYGKTSVKINCEHSSESLDALDHNSTNGQLDVSEIEKLEIENCAFPADGFRIIDFANSLGSKKINFLKIQNPKSPIKEEYLNGLSLDTLKFHEVNVSNLPANLLQNVQVRENLLFTDGDVVDFPKGLFEHVSSIKRMEISQHNLVKLRRDDLVSLTQLNILLIFGNRQVDIEEGVFNELENLKTLDLSNNHLKTLPAGIFHKLQNLERIHLGANDLNELPADLLRIEDSKLQSFRMSRIRGGVKSLPAGFFKNLRNLEFVQLIENELTSLPADLFSGAISLKNVDLASNKINELPTGIFHDATELKQLDLEDNELTSLPENVFSKSKLQTLNLDSNKLTSLTEGNLNGLNQLQVLSISKNALSNIYPLLYEKLDSIEEINVSHNQLTLENPNFPEYSIFINCVNLRKLDASYNKVFRIFFDFQLALIEEINLSGNELTNISVSEASMVRDGGYVNLSSNNISSIDFTDLENRATEYAEINDGMKRSVVVELDDNPLHCDCNILDLVRYLDNRMNDAAYDYVRINARKLKCASPSEFVNRRVIHLSSSELSCPVRSASSADVEDACSGICSCLEFPAKDLLVVDCSNRNLTSVPKKVTNPNNRPIELNLSGNELEKTPAMNQGYLQKVVSLDLSSNKISNVTVDVLSGSVQKLQLHNNSILKLNLDVMEYLKGNEQPEYLTLHQNEFAAECAARNIPSLDQKKMFE